MEITNFLIIVLRWLRKTEDVYDEVNEMIAERDAERTQKKVGRTCIEHYYPKQIVQVAKTFLTNVFRQPTSTITCV